MGEHLRPASVVLHRAGVGSGLMCVALLRSDLGYTLAAALLPRIRSTLLAAYVWLPQVTYVRYDTSNYLLVGPSTIATSATWVFSRHDTYHARVRSRFGLGAMREAFRPQESSSGSGRVLPFGERCGAPRRHCRVDPHSPRGLSSRFRTHSKRSFFGLFLGRFRRPLSVAIRLSL